MSGRALLILSNPAVRALARVWIDKAPAGTRVTFQDGQRSLEQNARMWAMLTDVSRQQKHCGRRYTPGQWKVLFLHACGREVKYLPSLDGSTFIPWGQSSSDLSKAEMMELLSFIEAWGAEHGVVFHDTQHERTAQ
jgi:NinB protein